MSTKALWDARDPVVFFIEKEAVRYIRAVGPVAWVVYTYLVHIATRAGRPVKLPSLGSMAERCGVTEDEVEHALDQLRRYRLLEITQERQRESASMIDLYRIVGLTSSDKRSEASAEMPSSSDAEERWERERDEGQALREMFDAMIEVCGYGDQEIDEAARGAIFSSVADIRADDGDADQIRAAAQLYRHIVPDLPLTPRSLAAAWGLLTTALSRNARDAT